MFLTGAARVGAAGVLPRSRLALASNAKHAPGHELAEAPPSTLSGEPARTAQAQ
jgi:hypothetical protein